MTVVRGWRNTQPTKGTIFLGEGRALRVICFHPDINLRFLPLLLNLLPFPGSIFGCMVWREVRVKEMGGEGRMQMSRDA